MFKYVLSAFICLAFAMPAAAQCGCAPAPRKTLGLVPMKISLPQISLNCETNECGCSRRKLSVKRVCVEAARPGLVDKKPCGGGLREMLGGLRGSLGSLGGGGGCGCAAPAPAPAPAPCGCEAAAPVVEAEPVIYADPVAAPVADCGCNG